MEFYRSHYFLKKHLIPKNLSLPNHHTTTTTATKHSLFLRPTTVKSQSRSPFPFFHRQTTSFIYCLFIIYFSPVSPFHSPFFSFFFSSLLFSTQSSLNAVINFPSFRFDFLHHSAISIRFFHLSISLYHFFPKLESMNSYRIINFTSFIHSFLKKSILFFHYISLYVIFSLSYFFIHFFRFCFKNI